MVGPGMRFRAPGAWQADQCLEGCDGLFSHVHAVERRGNLSMRRTGSMPSAPAVGVR